MAHEGIITAVNWYDILLSKGRVITLNHTHRLSVIKTRFDLNSDDKAKQTIGLLIGGSMNCWSSTWSSFRSSRLAINSSGSVSASK